MKRQLLMQAAAVTADRTGSAAHLQPLLCRSVAGLLGCCFGCWVKPPAAGVWGRCFCLLSCLCVLCLLRAAAVLGRPLETAELC